MLYKGLQDLYTKGEFQEECGVEAQRRLSQLAMHFHSPPLPILQSKGAKMHMVQGLSLYIAYLHSGV